jgi:hypothetical protein
MGAHAQRSTELGPFRLCALQFCAMAKKTAKNRTWAVFLIRKRREFLGHVEAADREAAETSAVAECNLSDEQRGRVALSQFQATPNEALEPIPVGLIQFGVIAGA